jgi:tetratricopeptide (TPR) repeat protein
VAQTQGRLRLLLDRAEQAAISITNTDWSLDDPRKKLVATAALRDEPAVAERVSRRIVQNGDALSHVDTGYLVAALADVGSTGTAQQALRLLPKDQQKRAREGMFTRQTSLAEQNLIPPDRVGLHLAAATSAAQRGDRKAMMVFLEEALIACPKQAAGGFKIGLQEARVGIAAAELGETDLANGLLRQLAAFRPHAAVTVPLHAALGRVAAEAGDLDQAQGLFMEGLQLLLSTSNEPFTHQAIDALFRAAASAPPQVGRKLLAHALAHDLDAPRLLPQAVRVAPELAELIVELWPGLAEGCSHYAPACR